MSAPDLTESPGWKPACPAPARVNLLPHAARLRLVSHRRRRFWLAVIPAAALLYVAAWQWTQRLERQMVERRTLLVQAGRRIAQQERGLKEISRRVESLRVRVGTLQAMQSGRSWAAYLAFVANAVPERAVLLRLDVAAANRGANEVAAGPATVEIQIDGLAQDHLVLAEFLGRLQSSPQYRRISLLRSVSESAGPKTLLGFGLACRE